MGDALQEKLVGGQFIKIKRDSAFLYVAIKGEKGGFSSLALKNDNVIKILHSSTRLITASYKKGGDVWQLSSGFKALKNVKRNKPVDEKEQIREFGWHANIVGQGAKEDTEFKIRIDNLKNKEIKVSIVFFQFKAKVKYAYAPEKLNDGSLNKELIAGGMVDNLYFNLANWFSIIIK